MPKTGLIIHELDPYANAVRPSKLADYLQRNGCRVDMCETSTLSRAGLNGLASWLPGLTSGQVLLFTLELVDLLARKLGTRRIARLVRSIVVQPMMRLRRSVLRRRLRGRHYDLVICENSLDMAFAAEAGAATIRILDLPAPSAEEQYFGHQLTQKSFEHLSKYESDLYGQADYISFHWPTYTDYVKRAKYAGPNFVNLSFGIDAKERRATYSEEPWVVFLGSLGGAWVNLPLLVRLCAIYPRIHVYGGPRQKMLGDRYKGYAPSTDVLADYQFGLITITDDPLRRSSFSSKQLQYYSYGLPVLSPDWRRDDLLDKAALLYNEDNFLHLIEAYKDPVLWQQASSAALAIAHECSWDHAFEPLGTLLHDDESHRR